MTKSKLKPQLPDYFRREAERRVAENQPGMSQALSEADGRRLVHELQVHQIELELQNDELQRVNAELDDALREYSDLYEFAPVGYFTLDDGDVILSANLAGAKLLGKDRGDLVGAPFRLFIDLSSVSDFDKFRGKVCATGEKHSCEVRLLSRRMASAYALIEAVSADGQGPGLARCRMSVTDITERKLAEVALQRVRDELETRVKERTRELAESIQALRESEAHELEFYRRTILAATGGKLIVMEPDKAAALVGPPVAEWEIRTADDLTPMRLAALALAKSEGIDEEGLIRLSTCIGEATTNAFKHAGGGIASIHRMKDAVVFKVEDKGPGIGAMSIPDVALVRGYSTAGTLGMGYKMMLSAADRVYLATGPKGMMVACEVMLPR